MHVGHGCILWFGSVDRWGYGRQWVTWPDGTHREERAHIMAYLVKMKLVEIPLHDDVGTQLDVSHLCHNKSCINPDHLVMEAHEVNMQRVHCVSQGLCTKNHTACLL